ncbi:GMC oxidoreductase [Cubamyces menziesii]|nr:GMC oxidoreductase [Cubamyces menziesii]
MAAIITAERFASMEFDYIIIGGGTAGLVLATRLSEDASTIVGVIEAGDWNPNVDAINVPGLCGSILGNSKYDWSFNTTPQRHLGGRSVFQPRGKALGGSSMESCTCLSSLDASTYRASAREYDAFEALGNPGWNWNEFLKYFKKSETAMSVTSSTAQENGLRDPDPRYHGVSGPIVKAYPTWFNPLHFTFLDTLETLGIPRNPDPDSGSNVGGATSFLSIDPRTARRTYSASAYFQPNAERQNLFILTNAVATKIMFDAITRPLCAVGVQYIHGDQIYCAAVRKEVVLAAGSLQTPQILELSGIGRADVLEKHGIQQILDLPGVGENLPMVPTRPQDHVKVYSIHEINPDNETLDDALDPEVAAKQWELYKSHLGYLSTASVSAYGFLPATAFASETQIAQWKEQALAAARSAPASLRKQLELQIHWFLDPESAEGELLLYPGFYHSSPRKPTPGARYSSMVSSIMHPLSRGSVHIASPDPTAPPAIDPNYFSNPLDLDLLLAVLKFALTKVYKTKPLCEAVRAQVAPSPDESASDEALKEYIKKECACVFHPIGTASMLPQEDGGVVDPDLKVYGTSNVRIVDASVIPIVSSFWSLQISDNSSDTCTANICSYTSYGVCDCGEGR